MTRDLRSLAVGLVLVAASAFSGAMSLSLALDNWDLVAPVGPAEPVPEFGDVRTTAGGKLRHADLVEGGQVTMLAFWATWCGACSMQMPTYASLEQRFADTDLRIIGVNRDDLPAKQRERAIAAYAEAKQIGFPHALDEGQLARAFRVSGIPHVVLIDRAGQIRYVHVGQVREKVLARELDELLDE